MGIVPTLLAITYLKTLESGRTKPGVFICEDLKGTNAGEYVVKLKNNIETGNSGLLREIIGSLLASKLGLLTPDPAIIEIRIELAQAVSNKDVAQNLKKSLGLNFGSKFIKGGYNPWPTGQRIPKNLAQVSANIFVFDALIQNIDRRSEKPNLLWKGNEIFVIDHELAFSFLLSIIPETEPWNLEKQPYLKNHVFFHGLQHTDINFNGIIGEIESLSHNLWNEIEIIIPDEWKDTNFKKIKEHIESIQQNLDKFNFNIRRILK